jgi:hypothetical protein
VRKDEIKLLAHEKITLLLDFGRYIGDYIENRVIYTLGINFNPYTKSCI